MVIVHVKLAGENAPPTEPTEVKFEYGESVKARALRNTVGEATVVPPVREPR